jgi:ammonia channel protein AmtB
MKMYMTKGKAFVIGIIAIMAIYFSMYILVLIKDEPLELVPVGVCLGALGTLIGLFFTQSVVNNGVKGKNWNQGLWDSENPQEEIK